jgi:hypothetical protein
MRKIPLGLGHFTRKSLTPQLGIPPSKHGILGQLGIEFGLELWYNGNIDQAKGKSLPSLPSQPIEKGAVQDGQPIPMQTAILDGDRLFCVAVPILLNISG